MSLIFRAKSALRNFSQRSRQERDLDDEVRAHLEMLIDEKLAAGMPAAEARRAAVLELEGVEQVKQRVREARAGVSLDHLLQDVRFGVRMLRKNPGFTLVALITLALGIGVNTAMFSIVDAVLLRPLPYSDAERLVTGAISLPDFDDVARSATSFEQLGVYASNLYTLRTGDRAEQVPGILASDGLLAMLGSPQLGRLPQRNESREPLAVLSYDFWQTKYGGRADVLGAKLNIGQTYTVVGVMPRGFHFPSANYQFWVTMDAAMAATPEQRENRGLRIFRAVGRLKFGVTGAQAQAELDAITTRLQKEYPETNREVRIEFRPVYDVTVGPVRQAMLVLLGTVALVLLIAAANVSNLLLARNAARERELAVRAALGAGRLRLIQQLATESVLLAGVGGAVGIAVAYVAIRTVQQIVPPGVVPRLESVAIDGRVLVVTALVSIITGLLFGIVPAWNAVNASLAERLKSGSAGGGLSRAGTRARRVLVITQLALALVVLSSAGLLLRSLDRLLSADAGFVSHSLLTGMIAMPDLAPERRNLAVEEILGRLRQLPGVSDVGAATGLPAVTPQRATTFEASGVPATENLTAYFLAATPGYFEALKTRMVAGRSFDQRDHERSPLVVIISEEAARELYPNKLAVGEKIRITSPGQASEWRTIVGVVKGVKYTGLADEAAPAIYTPYAQNPSLLGGVYLMIRTSQPPLTLSASVERTVAAAAPALAVVNLRSMEEVIHRSTAQPRFQSLLLGSFAALALALAAVGVYGVMSFVVAQHTRELGIRVALGAMPAQVAALMLRAGLKMVVIGVGLGVVAALLTTRVLQSLLYGVQPRDPATLVSASAVLIAAALLPCYIPARRAASVDPMMVLRQE